MTGKHWIFVAALLAAMGVAAGALGAHFLQGLVKKGTWSVEQFGSFETAVRYQMFHALALLVAGLLLDRYSGALLQSAAIAFLLGTIFFSGGIYGWLFTGLKPLVHVVPIGGTIWILGWLLLAAGSLACVARSPAAQ